MPGHAEVTTGEKLQDLHILIVDDDEAFITLIHAMLKSLGVDEVTQARTGAEAYQVLRNSEKVVDCIICDHTMDKGTGLQLLRAVRMGQVQPVRPDATFILLTASSDHDTVGNAARLDVSGYLVKPVTKDKIREAIAKARRRAIKIDISRYQKVVLPEDHRQ